VVVLVLQMVNLVLVVLEIHRLEAPLKVVRGVVTALISTMLAAVVVVRVVLDQMEQAQLLHALLPRQVETVAQELLTILLVLH
jgi:hypothetical protein